MQAPSGPATGTFSLRHITNKAYRRQVQYTRAEPLFLQALSAQKSKLGEVDAQTLLTQYALDLLYQSQGQYARAESLLGDVVERQRRLGVASKDARRMAETLAGLALALLPQHKHAEAEPLLRECLTIRQERQPDAWETFHVQALLGVSLVELVRRTRLASRWCPRSGRPWASRAIGRGLAPGTARTCCTSSPRSTWSPPP
jgi:tetratricopeptide (TPR) repeat protein